MFYGLIYPKIRNFFIAFYTKFQHSTICMVKLKNWFYSNDIASTNCGVDIGLHKKSYRDYYASYNLAQQTVDFLK